MTATQTRNPMKYFMSADFLPHFIIREDAVLLRALPEIRRKPDPDERQVHEPAVALRKLVEIVDGEGLDRAPVYMQTEYLRIGKKTTLHLIANTRFTTKFYYI